MGDHAATITPAEQWSQIIKATTDFLAQVAKQTQ
jgi:hypothetical protein